ncbi:MAG: hypothetical protein GY697_16670 [Desulfobacterales bacterium]|nr:hypothetical protein [Desulfobacterales bacterium]
MDFLFNTQNNITVFEVGMLLLLNTSIHLLNKPKLGMLINLGFTLYWGFFLNFDMLFGDSNTSEYSFLFFMFAILIIILTVVGLTKEED